MTIEPYAKPYYIRLHQKMWDWIADEIVYKVVEKKMVTESMRIYL